MSTYIITFVLILICMCGHCPLQDSTFPTDDLSWSVDLALRLKTTAPLSAPRDCPTCDHESSPSSRESHYCVATVNTAERSDNITTTSSSSSIVDMVLRAELGEVPLGECSTKDGEYRLDSHYPFQGSHDSQETTTPSYYNENSTVSNNRAPFISTLAKTVLPSSTQQPMEQPSTKVESTMLTLSYPPSPLSSSFLLVVEKCNKVHENVNSGTPDHTTHTGESGDCQQNVSQQWKCLKPSQQARLFEALFSLLVGAQKIKNICSSYHQSDSDKCVDSGGSSSSGQGSGGSSSSGKKQQNNRSGSSSSQRSGSGSSQRGGTGMGGRTHSGSSDSSDDNGDDDHNKRPRPQPNKEPKSKMDVSDDDDDEETDSADEGADEGADDTPRSMMVDVSPQSVQNDNGSSSVSSQGGGGGGGGGTKEQSSSSGGGGGGSGGRNIASFGGLPLLVSSGPAGSSRFSSVSSGGTLESITLKEGIAGGGMIGTTTLIASSPVNLAVGYGAPKLAATENDSLIAPVSTSVPGSELGTPTMDSPPPLGGRETPGTPPPMSPEIAPTVQVCVQ